MSGSRRNTALRMTVEQGEEARNTVEKFRQTAQAAFEGVAGAAELLSPAM